MLKQKRQTQILETLRRDGEVLISGLSRWLGVAEMTVRRDIDALARQGLLTRIHGGAVPNEQPVLNAGETAREQFKIPNKEGKTAVARKALSFICDGITVYFDSGDTVFLLAQCLPGSYHITALTNSIPTAMELVKRPFVSVIMIGGEIKKSALACRGPAAEDALERFRVDLAFVGVGAVGGGGELFTGSVAEAGFKKSILAAADQSVVLADSSKIGKQSLCRFADANQIAVIITDDNIEPAQLSMLHESGAQVTVAKGGNTRASLIG
ncbi:MAG: DeoR/GlpR family DNA-binding transcription regulator [Christensenellales bacterium]